MSSVRKSLLISFAESYAATILQFVSIMILSRMLTPKEIGVFSISMVFVNIAHILRDMGIGQYIVQEKELTRDRLSSAYGLSILVAWLIAGALALAAVPIAEFYQEAGIRNVILVIVLNFMLMPFATVPLAMWRRDLNFVPRFFISTTGTIASAVASITLAYRDFSYMSLAWGSVAGVATSVLLGNLVFRPKAMPWLPGFRELRHVFAFTTFASSASLIKEVGTGSPDMIVGKTLGVTEVSLLSRGASLVQLFESKVTSTVLMVALPLFAKTYREQGDFNWSYKRAIEMLTGIAWPFFAVLLVLAYPVIRILYGPQWDATVPILKILCLYGALRTLYVFAGQALLAVGGARQNFMLEVSVQPLLIGLVLLAAPYGLERVAFALVAAALCAAVFSFHLLRRHAGIHLRRLLPALARSFLLTLLSVAPPLAFSATVGLTPDNIWISVLAGGTGAALAWFIGVFLFRHALRDEISSLAARFRRAPAPVGGASPVEHTDGKPAEPAAPRPALRTDSLNGVRGLALLLVLSTAFLKVSDIARPAMALNGWENFGIFLFFTLTAFLLTLAFLESPPEGLGRWQTWRDYLLRRLMRIYPLFLTVLLTGLGSSWIYTHLGKETGLSFMLTPDEFLDHILLLRAKEEFWFIPVLFKFYLLLPLIVWFFAVPLRRNVYFCGIVTAALVWGMSFLESPALPHDLRLAHYIPVFLPAVYAGVLDVHWRDGRTRPNPLGHGGMKLLFELAAWSALCVTVGLMPDVPLAYGIACPVFLLGMLHGKGWLFRMLAWKPLPYLGTISFGTYLWHGSVLDAATHWLPRTPAALQPTASLAILLLLSALTYRWIESPFLRYGKFGQADADAGSAESESPSFHARSTW